MNMTSPLVAAILKTAAAYLGQSEKKSNSGFRDPVFEKRMKATGWQAGQSWCAYFSELVWKEAFAAEKKDMLPAINRLFSGGALATFANFKNSNLFATGQTPKVGALVIFQQGSTWQGHVGIVESITTDGIVCIEGNGSIEGSREGTTVVRKTRKLVTKSAGLHIIGFVYPE